MVVAQVRSVVMAAAAVDAQRAYRPLPRLTVQAATARTHTMGRAAVPCAVARPSQSHAVAQGLTARAAGREPSTLAWLGRAPQATQAAVRTMCTSRRAPAAAPTAQAFDYPPKRAAVLPAQASDGGGTTAEGDRRRTARRNS